MGVPREDTEKFVRLAGEFSALIFEGIPPEVQLKCAHGADIPNRIIGYGGEFRCCTTVSTESHCASVATWPE